MIRVVIDDKALRRFAAKAAAMADGKALLELKRGLQDGGRKVRTKVQRALKVQTGVKTYGAITARVISRSEPLTYTIMTTGKGLPISEFPVRLKSGQGAIRWGARTHWQLQRRTALGRFGVIADVPPEVTAAPWRVTRTFARSFVDNDGVPKAMARGDGKRLRKRTLFGPSLPKELTKGASLQAFREGVKADVTAAIHKRLARLMP